jgi:hypothetical protein
MLPAGIRIYVACGVTDMRKGFDGLAALVQTALELDPYGGALFKELERDATLDNDSIRSHPALEQILDGGLFSADPIEQFQRRL